jgi:HD-GYP domain-containing protein (c-di-GMP phosphodiesterase class II)
MFSGLLPRRRTDPAESPPATGTWASIRRMFSELLSRRRIDPAVAAPATGGPAALQAATAKPEAEAADYNTRIGPRLRVLTALCWRALRKLIGLDRADPDIAPASVVPTHESRIARIDGTPPGEDLTAEEHAEAALRVQGFEAELPRAARTIRQSLPVLLAAYRSAEDDRPLEIETLDPVVTEIVDVVLRNHDAMLWLTRLQAHDQAAHVRGLQAAVYMAQFGSHLGLPRADLERLALGGALLDIGKMQVPKEILRKPGPLDADELRQARSHVEIAMRLFDASGMVDSRVREIVERHHEREDGSGYPGRMLGDAIGLYGRIAGIVDTFLAMSEARPHAPALPMDYCLRVLLRAGGTLFHAPMVEHFIQMTGLYPVGSLVELSTGEIAAVLSHNRVRRLRPRVLVMVGADGEPLPRPMALDLLQQPHDAVGKEIRIVRGLPPGSHGIKAEDMFAATVPATTVPATTVPA